MVARRAMHRIARLSAAQDLPNTSEDFEELTQDSQKSEARFLQSHIYSVFICPNSLYRVNIFIQAHHYHHYLVEKTRHKIHLTCFSSYLRLHFQKCLLLSADGRETMVPTLRTHGDLQVSTGATTQVTHRSFNRPQPRMWQR